MQITKISNVQFYNFKGQHDKNEDMIQKYKTPQALDLMRSLQVYASVNSVGINTDYQVKNNIADISEKAHVFGSKLKRGKNYAQNIIDNILYREPDYRAAEMYFRNNPNESETFINNFKFRKEETEDGSLLVTRTFDNSNVLYGSDGEIKGVKYVDCTIFTNGFFGLKDELKPAIIYRNYSYNDEEITASEMYDFNNNEVYQNLVINANGKTYDEYYKFDDEDKQLIFFDNNDTKIEFINRVARYSYTKDGKEYQITTSKLGI